MKQRCIFEKDMRCPRCGRVEREFVETHGLLAPGIRVCIFCRVAEQIAYEIKNPDKIRRGVRSYHR